MVPRIATLLAAQIRTGRLVLSEYTMQDCLAELAYQSDSRYIRYPWGDRDLSAVTDFIQGCVARQADEPRDVFELAIALPAECGQVIGSCGVVIIFSNPQSHALSTTTDGPLHNGFDKPPADSTSATRRFKPYAEHRRHTGGYVRLQKSSGHAAPVRSARG
jgi:hypothetical protein